MTLRARWETFFTEALQAGGERNNVIHNPLLAYEELDAAGATVSARKPAIHLMRKPGSQPMSFKQVRAMTKRLDALTAEMLELLNVTQQQTVASSCKAARPET